MKVFAVLGTKNGVFDPFQIAVISVSALFGILFESIVLLVIVPGVLFLLTFSAKRLFFGGREEWPIYLARLMTGASGGYNLNVPDRRLKRR